MSAENNQGFNTRAVHAGQVPDDATGAVVPAIYQSSTFAQDGIGGLRNGYEYGRGTNPTRDSLQVAVGGGGGRHARVLLRLRPGRRRRADPRPARARATTLCWATTPTAEPTG